MEILDPLTFDVSVSMFFSRKYIDSFVMMIYITISVVTNTIDITDVAMMTIMCVVVNTVNISNKNQ